MVKFDKTVSSHLYNLYRQYASFLLLSYFEQACLPNADYNDGCLESIQCQEKLGEGAVCEKGKCVCGEDFVKVSFAIANETKSVCENRIGQYQLDLIKFKFKFINLENVI